jgi:hypothetical protein
MAETVSLTPFAQAPAAPEGFPGELIALAEFPLTFTDRALDMIRSALEETDAEDGEYLRVGVKGGGCSGFQYSLNFTDEVDDEDQLVVVSARPCRRDQAENDEPQPQVRLAFGLLNLKPAPWSVST